MRKDWTKLDPLGSFRTPRGTEAICWTHRGQGWDVRAFDGSWYGAANKAEAEAIARRLEDSQSVHQVKR